MPRYERIPYASLFTDRAIMYRQAKGFDHFKVRCRWEEGFIYAGVAEIEAKELDLSAIPATRTAVMLNLGTPRRLCAGGPCRPMGWGLREWSSSLPRRSRRIPLDDVIDTLAGELQDVAGAIRSEQLVEHSLRP